MKNERLIEKITSINWEFADEDTQYLSHNIHRYSGKFIPQIAKSVIELFTDEEDIVLDPYLGSGTTALEAILSGRKSIGIDINPLAILISEVKTMVLPIEVLENFRTDLICSLEGVFSPQMTLFSIKYLPAIQNPEESERFSTEWNQKWYQDPVLKQLIIIYR